MCQQACSVWLLMMSSSCSVAYPAPAGLPGTLGCFAALLVCCCTGAFDGVHAFISGWYLVALRFSFHSSTMPWCGIGSMSKRSAPQAQLRYACSPWPPPNAGKLGCAHPLL
ncbi:hypothetical protein COO60DRAFT_1017435 [Scenedesmus sp. NREL 46B-D3]|nr:hypothetical protein COO60DRAFT_1017435 [Scenedesmus sp. NREL 46B-D3]